MKLVLLGDVMLGRLVNQALPQLPPEYPWGDLLPLLASADIRFCNLECVIADSGSAWTATPKVFRFRSDAANIAVLKAARIDCVSLANNHVLDYGYDALLEMILHLDRAGICHAGADNCLEAATTPAVFACCSVQVGFLAFTDNEPEWKATHRKPGVLYVPTDSDDPAAQALLTLVSQTRQQVDWLIVSAHWGPNWGDRPSAEQIGLAHALVDHGADLIFGHSCHVVQGIELYRNRPILYSCGDFIDDYAVDPVERNDLSFAFVVELDESRVRNLLLYPTCIRRCQAQRAQPPDDETVVARMKRLCAELGTQIRWNTDQRCLEIVVTGA